MKNKNIPSKEIDKLFGEEYNKILDLELRQIDKEIDLFHIEAPPNLTKSISHKTGLKLYTPKDMWNSYKIATAILAMVILSATFIIANPRGGIAFKNMFRSLIFDNTNVSFEFNSAETKFFPELPNDFELLQTIENMNFIRKKYGNESGHYIEISLYAAAYKLSLDNEKYEHYEDITINDFQGKKISKDNTTTVIVFVHDRIVSVKSILWVNDTIKCFNI